MWSYIDMFYYIWSYVDIFHDVCGHILMCISLHYIVYYLRNVCVYVCVCVCVCVCVWSVCLSVCLSMYVCMYVCMHMCACVYTHCVCAYGPQNYRNTLPIFSKCMYVIIYAIHDSICISMMICIYMII